MSHLTLLAPSARSDTPEHTDARRGLIALAKGCFELVSRGLLLRVVHFGKLDDERLTSTILSMAGAVGPGALLQEKAIIGSPDSCRHLPNITCPTLASFSP